MAAVDWLDAAMHDTGRVELRHEHDGRWTSGLFDDMNVLRAEVCRRAGSGNLFTSLNAPRIVRAVNSMGSSALTDGDIAFHVRLPFDFDPVRPKGQPSTDAELDAALVARDRLVATLHSLGWPMPALACSGNGAHAVYRCRLRACDETREVLRVLYTGLHLDFNSEAVEFDRTVRNAGRIWRLYGTVNRKGTTTAVRRHRLATVTIPGRWEGVSPGQVEQLASSYVCRVIAAPSHTAAPARGISSVKGHGDYGTLDVAGWLRAHGLYRRSLGGGKHAVRCPWDHEHSTVDPDHSTATVVWEAEGRRWPTFHCAHAHCAGRGIHAVMELLGDADAHCARPWRTSTTC
ncbi:MAG: hypothetical protein KDD77_12505 [Caldilineaceae bacterium]|nr:hypothetical protein [Caldilineaceae bacterium]